MRVICVNNVKVITKFDLTIGKEYDAYIGINGEYDGVDYYVVKNDSGIKNTYPKKYFITIEEYRNKKLEEIGI